MIRPEHIVRVDVRLHRLQEFDHARIVERDRSEDELNAAGFVVQHAERVCPRVRWHEIEPFGSSFRSHNGGELLLANDTWFAPTDLTIGPDGAVYVSDWMDKRTAHPDPDAEWDRSNGRVYRVQAIGAKSQPVMDVSKMSSAC